MGVVGKVLTLDLGDMDSNLVCHLPQMGLGPVLSLLCASVFSSVKAEGKDQDCYQD